MINAGDRTNRRVILAIIITVVVMLALIGGYFMYKSADSKKLNNAFSLGYNASLQETAKWQTQNLQVLTWQNNSIQPMSLQDICGGAPSSSEPPIL